MFILSSFFRVVGMFGLFVFAGCAHSAFSLRPDTLIGGQNAFMGALHIYDAEGTNITGYCYAEFADNNDKGVTRVSMDDTGWIFAAARADVLFLSHITCSMGSQVVNYSTWKRKMRFSLDGQASIAYFGHITIKLPCKRSMLPGALFGSITALVLADTDATIVTVADDISDAREAFKDEYSSSERKMTVVNAVIQLENIPTTFYKRKQLRFFKPM